MRLKGKDKFDAITKRMGQLLVVVAEENSPKLETASAIANRERIKIYYKVLINAKVYHNE